MKNTLNKYLRKIGAEIHGVGYIEKLRNSDQTKDEWLKQQQLLSNRANTIFDVGANRGKVTAKYRELFPSSTIHAFEPFPESCSKFKEVHSKDKNIVLNELALSNQKGTAEMKVNYSIDTNSLLESQNIGASSDKSCKQVDSIEIETLTIDQYCSEKGIDQIDILKMDTQGLELAILQGAEEMLAEKRIRLIYTESYFVEQYVKQPLFHDLSKFLYEKGFVLQDFYDPYYSAKKILWCDSIFILSGLD